MSNMIIIDNIASNTEIKTTQNGNQLTVVSAEISGGHKETALHRCSKCYGHFLFCEFTQINERTIQYECVCGHIDKIIQ